MMSLLVIPFSQIGQDALALVGGKGANLGRLASAGLPVPEGFCVTTHAYRQVTASTHFEQLVAALGSAEPDAQGDGAALRDYIRSLPVPITIAEAIERAWDACGSDEAYAVRSSATAEDLPHASFAGQQDTYLNIIELDDLIDKVRACWASLFTDRAIIYRRQHGIAHAQVALAVVVQRMVQAEKSGILFTAHPVTGHRHIATIDAGFGLGEALVSGVVSADLYEIDKRTHTVLTARPGDKEFAIMPLWDGGTERRMLSKQQRRARVLTDEEALTITAMGERIERHYGTPQDIEWCMEAGMLYVVQARPITSLYPLLDPPQNDSSLHVNFCINHFQVMTDAMPPMALQLWRLILPFGKGPDDRESPWVHTAGGRLFLDASKMLRVPFLRKVMRMVLGNVDTLAQAAIEEVTTRPVFATGPEASLLPALPVVLPKALSMLSWLLFRDPSGAVERVNQWMEALIARLRQELRAGSLSKRMQHAEQVLSTLIFEALRLPPMVFTGIIAGKLLQRLTDRNAIELAPLGRGLEGNITTEMDLAVGDLADAARPYPALVNRLKATEIELATLADIKGGEPFAEQLDAFLKRYGARAPSEIDVSRERWRERPQSVIKTVAGALATSESGAHRKHHQQLATQADELTEELLWHASRGLFGPLRKRLVRRLVRLHRALSPLREHPKFLLISVMDEVRTIALEAGHALTQRGRLDSYADIFFLQIGEVCEALDDARVDIRTRIAERKSAFAHHQSLYPPRVVTSDGEIPQVRHDRADLPEGALAGTAASAGVVEGVARVITDPETQVLAHGEILIAPFTDPGWTPLFINASALVMEVGGMMTHGSVVAREYGIPAVVCVPAATTKINSGDHVRVNGNAGYVQIIAAAESSRKS